MASSVLSLFATVTVVVVCFSIQPSSCIPQKTSTIICSNTQDPKTCQSVLTTDPRTNNADLPQLSLISIELLSKQALNNFKAFSAFRNNPTFANAKASLDECVQIYQQVQAKIQEAYRLSLVKQYKSIAPFLAQSKKLAFTCAAQYPINSAAINSVNMAMLIRCEASISVNSYIMATVKRSN